MRAKSTLLTAIAAGIVFVSGMIILGKNPFNKKEQMKKEYVDISRVEIVGSPAIEGVADAGLKEINLKEASMKKKRLSEKEKLLAMLQVVLVDADKEKMAFNKKEAVRMRRGKRFALSYKGRHVAMTHSPKESYKIREPSAGGKIQLANFETTEGDKGG